MTDRQGLETELVARLQVASNSTLYPSARITTIIQNAYLWATQLVVWHDLVRARYTDTIAGDEYYNYPENFRSESIIRIEIDGEDYARKNFEDYLEFKKNNPTSVKKIMASFGRQFFISPVPTVSGKKITAWGAIQADPLTSASSIPVFSYNKEEANEAVVKKGLSIALVRSDPVTAKNEEQDAIAILMKLHTDEDRSTQRNQRLQHPMYDIPDYFNTNGGISSPYARFSYDPSGEGE